MARGRAATATPRNVRVYTVNDESRCVVVRNIPALGVADDALQRMSLFGEIEVHRSLGRQRQDDEFTESVWVKYETVNSARHAKVKVKLKPVVGSVLRVVYAPEGETAEDTAAKLKERREMIERRAEGAARNLKERREMVKRRAEVASTELKDRREAVRMRAEDVRTELEERRAIMESRAPPRPRRTHRDEAEQTRGAGEDFIGPQLPPPHRTAEEATPIMVPRAVDRAKRRRI